MAAGSCKSFFLFFFVVMVDNIELQCYIQRVDITEGNQMNTKFVKQLKLNEVGEEWAAKQAAEYINRHYYNVSVLEERHIDNVLRFLNERIALGYTAWIRGQLENEGNNPTGATDLDIQNVVRTWLSTNTPNFHAVTADTHLPAPTIQESLQIQKDLGTA